MENNYYQILGVNTSATQHEIKSAYKKLAKDFHPDKNSGSTFYEEKFKKVNEAYQTLSNPVKKSAYDLRLQYQNFTPPPKHQYHYNPSPPPVQKTQQKKSRSTKAYSQRKIYLIVLGVFLFTGFSGYGVYKFMNNYTSEMLFEEALKLEKEQKYRDAFMAFTDALSYNENLSEAYSHRAFLRILLLDDYIRAEYDYTNALATANIVSPSLYFDRAKCFIQQKKYSSAISDLDSAIRINQKIDSALYYRAEIYYFIENYEKAIPDYKKFYSAFSDCNDCLLKTAFSLYKTGKFSEALERMDAMINNTPKNGELYYYRGNINMANENIPAACSDMKQASSLGFKNAEEFIKEHCSK